MPQSYYATQSVSATSGQNELLNADGTPVESNPGERAMVPINKEASLPGLPGAAKPVGTGAQVGIIRNLEFSAGGRAHRISTGPYTKA
jgi:hypothetical protein